jgi:hypothetical protein
MLIPGYFRIVSKKNPDGRYVQIGYLRKVARSYSDCRNISLREQANKENEYYGCADFANEEIYDGKSCVIEDPGAQAQLVVWHYSVFPVTGICIPTLFLQAGLQ